VLASTGQSIYQAECATCHGDKGDRVPVAPLNVKAFLDSRSDTQLIDVVAHGTGVMPPFGKRPGVAAGLSDDQVKAVVAYLRSSVDAGVAARVSRGRSLYLSDCLSCHGEKGDRVPNVLLASPDFLRKEGDPLLAQVIVEGKGTMPGLLRAKTAGFDVEDVAALQTYLKTWAGLPAGAALPSSGATQAASAVSTTGATAPASTGAPGAAVAAPAPAAAPAAASKDVAQGKDIFGQKCVACHGAKGDQLGTVKLMDAGFLQQRGDDALLQTISTGKGGMPAQGKDKGGTLTGDDIAAVLAYLKSQAGIAAPGAAAAAAPAAAAPVAPAAAAPAAAPFAPAPAAPAAPAPLTPDEQALVSHGKSLFATNCTTCHGESKEQLGKLGNGTWLVQRGDRAISQTIADGKSVPGAPLAMPAFSTKLSADDISAVIAYLKSVAGVSLTAAPVAAGPDPAHGKEVFGTTCSTCHGAKGDQLPTAKLNDASFLQQRGEAGLTQIITSGKGGMPAFGGKLSTDDIASVVAFLQAQAGLAPGAGGGGPGGGTPSSPSAPAAPAGAAPAAPSAAGTPAAAPAAGAAPAVATAAPAAPVPAAGASPGGGGDGGDAAKGKDLFGSTCTGCHGAKGDQIPTAKLTDSGFLTQKGDQALTQSITSGKGGMPAFGGKLSADDIAAVLAYLKSTAGVSTTAAPAAASAPAPAAASAGGAGGGAAQGKDVFTANCTACHGAKGDQMPTAKLNDPAFLKQRGDQALTDGIAKGKGGMPAWSGKLSADDISAVVAYIKSLAGLDAGGSDSGAAAAPAAPAAKPDPAATDPSEPLVDVTPEVGRELFGKNCAMCHGEDGQRMPGIKLLSPDWSGGMSGKSLNSRITNGAPTGGMPAFSKTRGGPLSVTQVAAIVAYIKDTAGGVP
jgi:mono/diheme cytochrome c family protein